MAVACVEFAAQLVRVWQRFSFPTRIRENCTCVLCCPESYETCTCHYPGFEKRRNKTFGRGVAGPFVILLPASRSWASAVLGHGGGNRGAVAASSIPQGIRGSNHSHGCLVVSGAYHLPHGRRQANQKHCKEKVIVRADIMGKVLLGFPHGYLSM